MEGTFKKLLKQFNWKVPHLGKILFDTFVCFCVLLLFLSVYSLSSVSDFDLGRQRVILK